MKLTRRSALLAGGGAIIAAPGIAGLLQNYPGVEIDAPRNESLWTRLAPTLPGFDELQNHIKADLTVIGAGYTGLSCAYYTKLMRPDWRVVVLDSHLIGSGASSRNSGAVSAVSPGVSAAGFGERGLDRLKSFIETEQVECDFQASPALILLATKDEVKRASASTTDKVLTESELAEATGKSQYAGAIEKTSYYSVQPAKLVSGLVQAAIDLGVEFYERSPVVSVDFGLPATAITPKGRVASRHILIATNAYTPRLNIKRGLVFPIHHYTVATKPLESHQREALGLDRWPLRFENRLLAATSSLMPSNHFFMRMALGYASEDSQRWDENNALALTEAQFRSIYPSLEQTEIEAGWHGVTGHTLLMKPVVDVIGHGNVHINVAHNGLGIMAGHNNGHLSACAIVGRDEADIKVMTAASTNIPFPGRHYRSLILRPAFDFLSQRS